MGTTYERCDKSVEDLANEILSDYQEHEELLAAEPKIDFVFASTDQDRPALKLHGKAAYAIARKIGLKDRALGRGDCEIAIDRQWWNTASKAERRALLDHELFHFGVDLGKRDDLGRPVIWIRRHDIDVGWFKHIAKRHGSASLERQQAKIIFEDAGQLFWPEVFQPALPGIGETATKPSVTIKSGDQEVTMSADEFSKAAKRARQTK
jgi:hypothetical protein